MQARKSTYSKHAPTIGGLLFGLYYTICLYYFETFSADVFLRGGEGGGGKELLLYLPVAVILTVAAVVLGRILFGELKQGAAPRPGWMRWAAIPLGFFVSTWSALAIYGAVMIHDTNATSEFLLRLLIFMLIAGLLPLQAALMIIPQPKARKRVALEADEDAHVIAEADAETKKIAGADAATFMLVIEASQGEPQFKIAASELVAVEAADNYCKFHHVKDGQRKTKVLRMTMKEAEEALQGAEHFYRCHRSFLVNGAMVEEVLGNSQAYRLKMRHLEEPVPVSRAFDVEPLRPRRD